MKNYISIFFFFLAFSLSAQSKFEGKIQAIYYANGEIVNLEYWLSPQSTALEMSFQLKGKVQKMIYTYNMATNHLVILGQDSAGVQKTTQIPLSQVNSSYNYQSNRFNYAIAPTTQVILGFNCKKYIFHLDNQIIESWIASDIEINTENLIQYLKNDIPIQLMYRENIKGFPLQTIIYDEKGVVLSKTEVMAVTPFHFNTTDFDFGK